jgi:uncharacterized protein
MNRRQLSFGLLILVFGAMVFLTGYMTGRYIAAMNYRTMLAQNNVKGEVEEKEYPLMKYSFAELSKRGGIASEIKIVREMEKTSEHVSYLFKYESEGKTISGLLTVPAKTDGPAPVLLLLRGFVPPEEYVTGMGSRVTAGILAKNGYVSFSPDFLGFGESDPPPAEAFAERFIKPMNVIDLMASIDALDKQLVFNKKTLATLDTQRFGMWGHSNGGQIGLSVLEILKRPIPTVFWAPVTKEFPYSILYFMDEAEDKGKGLRALTAGFEKDYNVDDFSIGNRIDEISAKIQLHQGGKDTSVPQKWSDEFYSYFVGKGKKDQIEYFLYPNSDHGMSQDAETAYLRTVTFFDREVKNKKFEPTPTPTPIPEVPAEATDEAAIGEEPSIAPSVGPSVSPTKVPSPTTN